jgi:uncharacterized membrane protein
MDEDWSETLEHRLLHRLMFFTDAVFAIVMTLLVLELRPPAGRTFGEAMSAVADMGGQFFAFALSFTILSLFWVAHMATTRRLVRFDWPVAAVNLIFLFPICLIPFVSAWVGEGADLAVSWSAYCAVLIATSLGNIAVVLVQSRGGGRLLAGGVTARERGYRLARAASPGLAFSMGLVGVWTGHAFLALFCGLLIPVFMGVARLTLQPRPEPAAKPKAEEAETA